MVSLLNAAADGIEFCLSRFGRIAAPTALGAIGGRLIGAGYKMGALQGAVSGAVFSWLVSPLSDLVKRNTGPRKDQIHTNTSRILRTCARVLMVAVPIFVTVYHGDAILNAAAAFLPVSWRWLVAAEPAMSQYNTAVRAFLVNIAPAIAQEAIVRLKAADRRSSF